MDANYNPNFPPGYPNNLQGQVDGRGMDSIERRMAGGLAALEAGAAFLQGQYLQAAIERAVSSAVTRSMSPWLDRQGAADYVRVSVSEIDRAAAAGVFATHRCGSLPRFHKEDLDKSITSGAWCPRGK